MKADGTCNGCILVQEIHEIPVALQNHGCDKLIWKNSASREFSVKSTYAMLVVP